MREHGNKRMICVRVCECVRVICLCQGARVFTPFMHHSCTTLAPFIENEYTIHMHHSLTIPMHH